MALGARGQMGMSWTWAIIAMVFCIGGAVLFYALFDQVWVSAADSMDTLGSDPAHMSWLGSVWNFIPIVFMVSLFMFLVIVANAARGGDF